MDEIVFLFKTNSLNSVYDLKPLVIYFLCIFNILLSIGNFQSAVNITHCPLYILPCHCLKFFSHILSFCLLFNSLSAPPPQQTSQKNNLTLFISTLHSHCSHSILLPCGLLFIFTNVLKHFCYLAMIIQSLNPLDFWILTFENLTQWSLPRFSLS